MSNTACKYYTERTLGWMLNNKIIVLLSLLSFSLFVSTLAIAGQRNRLHNELEDLKNSLTTTEATPETTLEPTEAPTVAPTAAPTEAPIVAPTEAPAQPPTEAPVQPQTEAPVEPPTEAPPEVLIQAPVGRSLTDEEINDLANTRLWKSLRLVA